jgi:hypothetical protein
MPTRNTLRGGRSAITKTARQAKRIPKFTPACSTAAIHGRHLRGQVSDSRDDPTAHSPPMPSAEMNRKISSCHHVCAKNDIPVNAA